MGFYYCDKEIIEKISALGKDFVIIDRSTDVILGNYNNFKIFVCAEMEAEIKHCMEQKAEDEILSEKEILHRLRHIDKMCFQTRAIISGSGWGQRDACHLTVNTTDWNIKELAPAVAEFANCWFGRT